MCLKESRWRRFTADSVTEITIVSEWHLKLQHLFLKNSAEQLHVVGSLDYSLGCVGGELYTLPPLGLVIFIVFSNR